MWPRVRPASVLAVAAAVAVLAFAPRVTAGGRVAEPDAYRDGDYRAPVPATLAGAEVIDTDTAERWWREKAAVFVDVMPRDEKPDGLPEGTIWRDARRDNIPGSAWLPNVGYGGLSAPMEAYFRRSLDELSGQAAGRPLVFYCLADCWMSWNAARRALEYGHAPVAWYPEGTDGWAGALLPLERATPRP